MASYALDNEIRIGSLNDPSYIYRTRQLVLNSPRGAFSLDVFGNELAVDEFSFIVCYNDTAPMAYSPTNADVYVDVNGKIYLVNSELTSRIPAKEYLTDVVYGTPVWWYVAGAKFAKGYVKSIARIAKSQWKIFCMSGVGLLNDKMHVGGLYTGALFKNIFASIVGGAFEYGMTNEVGNTRVYGWLPYDKARNNLHRLLFAVGASLWQGVNVDYNVVYLSPNTAAVPSSRIALGGSVQLQIPATGAEVTEHGFSALASDEIMTLFDNTQGDAGAASNLTVVFSEPMHDLTVTGTLVINSSGVNYAVVSGTGTLTGKRYTHSKSIVAVGDTTSAARNVKRVNDNCLISTANSWNVAQRILSYFQSAKTVKAKMILNNEKPGQNLAMTDAFGEEINAYLSKMEVMVTTVKGASCELIEGYTPDFSGNNFTQRTLIDANGTWTSTKQQIIRIVLIGGAAGGQGGYDGTRGMGGIPDFFNPKDYQLSRDDDPELGLFAWYWNGGNQMPVPGGAAGSPGASGNILVATVEVAAGEVLTFTIGTGGAGGAKNGGAGTAGLPTSVSSSAGWTLTSADGVPSEIGYRDVIGNVTLALPGEAGHQGGAGGMADTVDFMACKGGDGLAGGSVGQWRGGKGGKGNTWDLIGGLNAKPCKISAAGGGGAAWGANGGDGGAAEKLSNTGYGWYRSGKPGNGANAVKPSKPTYGSGGSGGNGGGSGGNVAGMTGYYVEGADPGDVFSIGWGDDTTAPFDKDKGGKPGDGSEGGDGGDGCGLIYSS